MNGLPFVSPNLILPAPIQQQPGYGAPPQGYGAPPQGYAPPPQGYAAPPQGYGAPPEGYGGSPQGYGGAPPQGYAPPPQGYGAPPQGYDAPPQGYGAPPQGAQNMVPVAQVSPLPVMTPPGPPRVPPWPPVPRHGRPAARQTTGPGKALIHFPYRLSCWRPSPGSRRPTSTRCSTPSARTCSTPRRTPTAAPDRCQDVCTLPAHNVPSAAAPLGPLTWTSRTTLAWRWARGSPDPAPGHPPVPATEVPVLPLLLLSTVHGGQTLNRTNFHCCFSIIFISTNAGELPAWNCSWHYRAKLHLHLSKVIPPPFPTSPVSL